MDYETTARIEALRTKREALLRSPRAPKAFGSWWTTWRAHHAQHGRASAAAVEDVERRTRIVLPTAYRRFLIEVADGGMGPGCGMFSLDEALDAAPDFTGDWATPFCYGNDDARAVLARRAAGASHDMLEQPNDEGLPHGCLLLAHTGCGCFDILVLEGEQRGTVWFHDVQRLCPLSQDGEPLTFFDWYESWLDDWLRSLRGDG